MTAPRPRCPDGRPLYPRGEIPDHLASVSALHRRFRRRAPGQRPVATSVGVKGFYPLYAVAASIPVRTGRRVIDCPACEQTTIGPHIEVCPSCWRRLPAAVKAGLAGAVHQRLLLPESWPAATAHLQALGAAMAWYRTHPVGGVR